VDNGNTKSIMSISIKLFYKDEVRRFAWSGHSFQQLKEQCRNVLNIPNDTDIVLKYDDNEGDLVTFSSDEELAYGRSLMNNVMLRIRVHVKQEEDEEDEEEEVIHKDWPTAGHWRNPSGREGHHPRHEGGGPFRGGMWRGRGGGRWRRMDGDEDEVGGRPKKVKELDGRFVQHVTVDDDTEQPAGIIFQKTWRFRNTGILPWPTGTSLLRVDRANELSCPDKTPLGVSVLPGNEIDVTVTMKSPIKPGRYATYFKLCTPDGKKFGQRMRCQILTVGTEVFPEKISQIWEQLEVMGFVQKGARPSDVLSLIMQEKGNLNNVVREMVARLKPQN